jgi:hypothetical protein
MMTMPLAPVDYDQQYKIR